MLLKKQFSFFLSSDPESGATNVAADGSSFQVNLNSPIMYPLLYATSVIIIYD